MALTKAEEKERDALDKKFRKMSPQAAKEWGAQMGMPKKPKVKKSKKK